MADAAKPFALIVKPVGSRCNMRCSYCYYLEKARLSSHERQSRMRFDLLEKLIRQAIESSPGPVVSFIWHGGEPTLAGLEFYRKAVGLQKKYLPKGWEAWNNLQTNGLLLNDEWCRFLRANRFDVGLSIDGCETVHDKNRRDVGGHPTYERVRRTAERLRRAGIEPDLLCTVTADSAAEPLAVYRALKALGTGWIQFIPVLMRQLDGSMSRESVTPEAYGRFLCAIFDEWVQRDLGEVDVQLFAETARVWAGGEPSVCTMTAECGRVLVAEEDGSVYACDHFVDAAHRLGNLSRERLSALAESEEQRRFGALKRESLTKQCRDCPWLSCCGGGCLKDRFGVSDEGEAGQYYLCGGLRQFFAHAREPMERMMALSRQGLNAAAIRAAMGGSA